MTIFDAINSRFSCRRFSNQAVEREQLQQLMEAGHRAPSACNSQRWLMIAVDDPDKRSAIAGTMRNEEWNINHYAEDVPAFIAVINHPVRTPSDMQRGLLGKDLSTWAEMDQGMVVQNICLAATGLGLGSVIMGWFDQKKAKEVLGVPSEMSIPVMIAIGHPAFPEKARKTPRIEVEKAMAFNEFPKESV